MNTVSHAKTDVSKVLVTALYKERWISVSIKYIDFQEFIFQVLIPFSEKFKELGMIKSLYYKVEYYKDVMQISFQASQFNLDTDLKPSIFRLVKQYYQNHSPEILVNSIDESILEPKRGYNGFDMDNFKLIGLEEYYIDPMTYTISIQGAKALQDLYAHSTILILDDFQQFRENGWTIEDSIEKGLSLHLAVLHAFTDSQTEIYHFLAWVTSFMLDNIRKLGDVVDMLDWKFKTIQEMEANFQSCKEAIFGYTKYVLESLKTHDEFEEDWLNQWVSRCYDCKNKLDSVANEGRLLANSIDVSEDKTIFHDLSNETYRKWQVLYSILATLNSQLGIAQNYNLELGIFYSMKQSLMILTQDGIKSESVDDESN